MRQQKRFGPASRARSGTAGAAARAENARDGRRRRRGAADTALAPAGARDLAQEDAWRQGAPARQGGDEDEDGRREGRPRARFLAGLGACLYPGLPRGPRKMSSAYKRNISLKTGGTCLLIVDPQNDFHPGGSLGIPTADQDAAKIAAMICTHKQDISEIYVTLDTHMKYHIAHPNFWVNEDNHHPAPFTVITLEQIKNGAWKPARAESEKGLQTWVEDYVGSLEKQKRFMLTIWPEHCLIGSSGHAVRESIRAALAEWEDETNSAVTYVIKGNNSYTEHYSAIRAEVTRDDDKNTGLNEDLVSALKSHDQVLVCGQAKSHCVNFTVRDLADLWDKDNLSQLVILEDGSSSVSGFEKDGEKFVSDMSSKGLRVTTTDKAFPSISSFAA